MTGRVAAIVVTYDGLPWIEQCLASLDGVPTVVVDHGSTDGTPAVVRSRFPGVRVVEQENLGLAAGWNRGLVETSEELVAVLNSDAWLQPGSLAALVACADRHPQAGLICPRLLNTDGTLQPSVRGFPTLWRAATEYLFLRKLSRRSQLWNGYYAAGFDHASERVVEWSMGACFLLRRRSFESVGSFDERFFLFSEETDWAWRAREAGWQVVFTPSATATHVGGASHGGALFRENVRGQLRFFAKHRGLRSARRLRRLLIVSLRLRGLAFRGARGKQYRDVARWLAVTSLDEALG